MAKNEPSAKSSADDWSELQLVEAGMEQGAILARQLLVGHAYEVPVKGQFVMDGKKYRLDEKAPEVARRAATYFAAVTVFLKRCQRNDIQGMLQSMFTVGYLAREVFLAAGAEKPAEEAVETSYKVSQRSRKNAETVNAAHVELHEEYRAAVAKVMATGVKYSPATEEVAQQLGVSSKTVKKHCPNPNPRRTSNRKP
jgi:hypothetical protein